MLTIASVEPLTRSKSSAQPVDRRLKRQQYLDTIYFSEQPDALVDVASPIKASVPLLKGWVCSNDPFLQQMKVWTNPRSDNSSSPDTSSRTLVVKYREIKLDCGILGRKVFKVDDMPEKEKADEDVEVVEVKPKAKKQLMINKAVEDVLREVVDADCVTMLTFVPCQNGILEKLRDVYQYNQKFQTDRLFFDSKAMVAMADLHLCGDDLVTLRIPAVRLQLCDSDYHKERQVPPGMQAKPKIDQAFLLFSAIKRAVSFVKQERAIKKELCVATEINRQLLGFHSGKTSVSSVSHI